MEVDMDEVAMLVEYLTVYDYEVEIRLFGGKTINMTLDRFKNRKKKSIKKKVRINEQ